MCFLELSNQRREGDNPKRVIQAQEAEQDKQLAQKIIANELSGVFNWVLLGLNRSDDSRAAENPATPPHLWGVLELKPN